MATKEDSACVAGGVDGCIGGNPAKLIKKRFSDETIERLMKIDFSKWDEKFIMENMQRLYTHVEEGKK